MLKGSLSPYLDTHNEEESSYVTLSNGPYAYVADSTSTEHNSYNHVLVDAYFVTPILCKHCEDYIWGTGKVGVKCKDKYTRPWKDFKWILNGRYFHVSTEVARY
ncbi:uncharacterized protein LOC143897217 isoform X1 [Temnothorax americanus]|uniref:uncharacterized protein LOC143897217 isoform X1 n=1 Tax=Temnothorax americanus TaxID=1964332 RepID=UPI004067630D